MLERLLYMMVCTLVCSPILSIARTSNDSIKIVDGSHGTRGVGHTFVNRFSVASKKEAISKLETLRDLQVPVTVHDFLGGNIDFIRVVYYDQSFRNFSEAKTFLGNILNSIIISPDYGPALQINWAEGSSVLLHAEIFFEDSTISRLDTDGFHLFLEDNRGTFWWHRWDSAFPRKQLRKGS